MRSLPRLLAWRLVSRHRVRTLLLVLAVALPVAIASCLSSLAATAVVSTSEAQALKMGQGMQRLTERRATNVAALFPAGEHAVADQTYQGMPMSAAGGRAVTAKGRALDLTDPLTRGMFVVVSGAPARGTTEINLSRGLADRLGAQIGSTVTVGPQHLPMRVSSIVVFPRDTADAFFVAARPVPVTGPGARDIIGTRSWIVAQPVDTDAAEKAGVEVVDRRHVEEPDGDGTGLQALSLGLAAGLLAECLLLITAAISMVARSETRTAGLLAAMGWSSRARWSFLTRYTQLLTLLGAGAGVVAGLATAYELQGSLQQKAGADWGTFTPAWWVIAVICLLAAGGVLGVGAHVARGMRRQPLLTLLTEGPAGRRLPSRSSWALAVVIVMAGLGVVAAAWAFPYWAVVLGLLGSAIATAGLVMLSVLAGVALCRREQLPGSLAPLLAIRQLTSFPTRAVLTASAVAVVVSVGTFLQASSQMMIESAERNRMTPVPDGWTATEVHRPLTTSEVRGLGPLTASFALLDAGGPTASTVTLRTDLMDCISRTVAFRSNGGIDIAACQRSSRSATPFPRVAQTTSADVSALSGRSLTPQERAAYDAGSVAVLAGTTGRPGSVQLVTEQRKGTRLDLAPVATVPALTAPDAVNLTRMPTLYLAPAAANRLHLRADDPVYLVRSVDVAQIRRLLPDDVQADARFDTATDSPYLAPARAAKPVVVVTAVVTIGAILAMMMGLWGSDLGASRQMLMAMGARRRFLRWSAAALALVVTGVGTVLGTISGLVGTWSFTSAGRVPMPWTWAPLISGMLGMGVAVAVGALSVPSSAAVRRRG